MGAPFSGAGESVSPKRSEATSNQEEINAMTDKEGQSEEGAEEEQSEEEEQDKAEHRTLRKPEEPTQKEFEEHMVLHIPFRAWCPHCVKGRAKAGPHRTDNSEKTIPTVAMDYCYMKSKDDDRSKEEREIRGMPILVIKDNKTGYISANVVPRKGECNFAN